MPAVKASPARQSTLPYARTAAQAVQIVDLADDAASRALFPTDAAARKAFRREAQAAKGLSDFRWRLYDLVRGAAARSAVLSSRCRHPLRPGDNLRRSRQGARQQRSRRRISSCVRVGHRR